jgi:hypothetical protein
MRVGSVVERPSPGFYATAVGRHGDLATVSGRVAQWRAASALPPASADPVYKLSRQAPLLFNYGSYLL